MTKPKATPEQIARTKKLFLYATLGYFVLIGLVATVVGVATGSGGWAMLGAAFVVLGLPFISSAALAVHAVNRSRKVKRAGQSN